MYVVCSMYDIGICFCFKVCDSSPSHFKEQEHAIKYKVVCVFKKCEFLNMVCICFV